MRSRLELGDMDSMDESVASRSLCEVVVTRIFTACLAR